jgi:surfactin synthase thioesterase subunit
MTINEIGGLSRIPKYSNTIIMLPFAGGGTYSYNEIIKLLPSDIKVICPELPGRGALSDDLLIMDINLLINYIFDNWLVQLNTNIRYIIFGHSMGALLGFLLLHKIKIKGMKLPHHLVVSGKAGPRFIEEEDIYELPPASFRKKIKEFEGILPGVLADEGLMYSFEPNLRPDFKAVKTLTYLPEEPTDVPISILYGKNENLSERAISSWQEETTKKISMTGLDGNHFFIFEHTRKIADYLLEIIRGKD